MSGVIEKLDALGLTLREFCAPSANYVSYVQVGNLLMISGQICERDGLAGPCGTLGAGLSSAQGYDAARDAALGVLTQIHSAVQGDFSRVKRIVRLGVFIASTSEFAAHSEVANGASDLIVAVFGAAIGKHARTSVGVAALPAGVAVEVDAIVCLGKSVSRSSLFARLPRQTRVGVPDHA
jgi:enamine deaminase RidA (YjgF/YER057c/UK114 family)